MESQTPLAGSRLSIVRIQPPATAVEATEVTATEAHPELSPLAEDLSVALQSVFAQLDVAMKPLAGRSSIASVELAAPAPSRAAVASADTKPAPSAYSVAGTPRAEGLASNRVSLSDRANLANAAATGGSRPPSSLQQALQQRQLLKQAQAATPWSSGGAATTPAPARQPPAAPFDPPALFELPSPVVATGDPRLAWRINARAEPLAAEGRRLVGTLLRGVRVSALLPPGRQPCPAVLSLLPDLRGLLLRAAAAAGGSDGSSSRGPQGRPALFADATPASDAVLASASLDDLAAVVLGAAPGAFALRWTAGNAAPALELVAADDLARLDVVSGLALIHGLLPAAAAAP